MLNCRTSVLVYVKGSVLSLSGGRGEAADSDISSF